MASAQWSWGPRYGELLSTYDLDTQSSSGSCDILSCSPIFLFTPFITQQDEIKGWGWEKTIVEDRDESHRRPHEAENESQNSGEK